MEPSIELQVDNAVSVPYHDGLSMGNTIDFTKQLTKGTRKLVAEGILPTSSKIKNVSCKFSLADKFSHVCEVLDIPPEYALKVESGSVQNHVIKACLDDIYNKNAFKLIFRLRNIWELHEYTNPVGLKPDGDSLANSNNLEIGLESPLKSITDAGTEHIATHVVETLYVGDELVTILTVSASEFQALQTFYKKIEQLLDGRHGCIGEDTMLETFEMLGTSLDNKLSKSHYKNVNCAIQYGSFRDLDKYPTTVSGMVNVAKNFINNWKKATDANVNANVTVMKIGSANEMELEDSTAVEKMSHVTEVYNLRVALRPLFGNSTPVPEGYFQTYEAIFSCIVALKKTEVLIQEFLRWHNLFSNKDYMLEGRELYSRVLQRKNDVIEAIDSFAMVDPVTTEEKQRLQEMAAKMPDMVDDFIKRVTTKLPVGGDLNLLIIGKTGHGKSSTANTILRRKEFTTSSGGISETKMCQRSWSDLDGRRFKVVDVPGVCDTDLDSVQSAKLALKCISEAISTCSEGFHALLLVIRYGNRMTEEEERAIYILKCILGQAIIHSHCVCIVTHGDNFEDNEGSFEDWCRRQDGFLKEVFKECNYRCVLFDNKTSDPTVLKTQLIELVSKVDSLEHRGTCYTNDIFKHAERDRQRLVEELEFPHLKEEFLRDLNLLQGDFEDVEKADENERHSKLETLKSKTETLKLKLDKIQCGGITDIYQAVSNFSERLHRQKEKDIADAQLRFQREVFQQKEKQLREEREAVERLIAEQTEQRIREAAQKEQELRELDRKNLEEKQRHEKEVEEVKNNMANYYKKKSRWVTFRDSVFKW